MNNVEAKNKFPPNQPFSECCSAIPKFPLGKASRLEEAVCSVCEKPFVLKESDDRHKKT